jgi:hypothetical protein
MKTLFLATLILSVVGMVMGQKKSDKQTITETISNIFSGADERNWTKVQKAMAPEVYLDYTSLAGGTPATLKREAIVESWKGVLPGFQSTHHQIGNFDVKIEGNKATATFSGLALHYLNNETWTVVGTYDFALSKNSNGEWSVEKMKLNLQKQDGNLELPKAAIENVKNNVNFNAGKVSEENRAAVEQFLRRLKSSIFNLS